MSIGLIGQKRVGKDTVAGILKILNTNINYNFKTMALADPIKDIARVMFNFTEDQLYDDAKDVIDPKWGIKPRDFFEQFGTNIMQFDIYKYHPNINVIITDIRGLHEICEINKFTEGKAIFIRIVKEMEIENKINNNDNNNDNNSVNNNNIPLHITQREPNEMPDEYIFDTIVNNSTLEELKIKVEKVWKRIEFIYSK